MANKILNKSFLYFFPVMYKYIIDELEFEYKPLQVESIIEEIENTYLFLNNSNVFVVEFSKNAQLAEFLEALSEKCNIFMGLISEDNPTLLFNIPEMAKDCYYKFINGKYSKFSNADKTFILTFINAFISKNSDESSLAVFKGVKGILEKDSLLKKVLIDRFGIREDEFNPDWELSSIIDIEKETYYFKGNEDKIQKIITQCSNPIAGA